MQDQGEPEQSPDEAKQQAKSGNPAYDLAERTAKFGEIVIVFCKAVPKNVITRPLIDQLIRSATSVGANYCEADEAVSKKEFRQKIGYCVKEARETKYWLRMMATADENFKDQARNLWTEAHALHRIFATIWRRSRS